MKKTYLYPLIIVLAFQLNSFGQSSELKGWFFITQKYSISKKWDVLADIQLRSSNKLKHFETVLLRTAISYNINDKHAVAAGYAHKADWEEAMNKTNEQTEHRIYEQYLYNQKLKRTEFNVRFRLEQRFIKEDDVFDFSQRLRGFASFQIPLSANADFSKGVYTTLQNELFMNVLHKDRVNNNLFDQNRAYISLGYRWSKKIDTEIGYMYWLQKETDQLSNNNVIQLMLTTQF